MGGTIIVNFTKSNLSFYSISHERKRFCSFIPYMLSNIVAVALTQDKKILLYHICFFLLSNFESRFISVNAFFFHA